MTLRCKVFTERGVKSRPIPFLEAISSQLDGALPFLVGHSVGGTPAAVYSVTEPRSSKGLYCFGAQLKCPLRFSNLEGLECQQNVIYPLQNSLNRAWPPDTNPIEADATPGSRRTRCGSGIFVRWDEMQPPDMTLAGCTMDSQKSRGSRTLQTQWRWSIMAPRINSTADLKAARTGIGTELKKLFSDVLREPLTDRMAQLLSQLDYPADQPAERRSEE
jgi:pimeloyl-ACP methyl ester carboxylesterase